jgi:hypothetical protein
MDWSSPSKIHRVQVEDRETAVTVCVCVCVCVCVNLQSPAARASPARHAPKVPIQRESLVDTEKRKRSVSADAERVSAIRE